MLVLSRKVKQKILIGEEIEVVVVQIKRGEVRLGIKAPDAVMISREEVVDD